MTCTNHPDQSAEYTCAYCKTQICANCYDAFRFIKHRKSIPFCSDACKSQYRERLIAIKCKNRKRSYQFILLGAGLIAMSLLLFIIRIYIEFELGITFESGWSRLADRLFRALLVPAVFFTGVGYLFNFIRAFFSGENPDLL